MSENKENNITSQRILELLHRYGMTQTELGNRIGLTRTMISM